MPKNPDTLVIGAGLAGLSVAAHLAPHGSVAVIDQAARPGSEASAQNAGMVRRLGEDPYERALALRTASRLAHELAEASRVTGAVLGLVRDPHHLTDGVAHLRAAGVRVEALDRPAEVAPALDGAPLLAAWYLPDERVADAHTLVQHFLATARRHAAQVDCGVPAEALCVDQGRVVGVRTASGIRHAGRVVLAAGAWSGVLAARAGLRRPLFPLRRTLVHSAAHPLSRPDHPWCWIDDAGVYARPEGEGWLISGCDEAHDPPQPGPGSRGPVDPELRALAADKLDRWMPALADARFTGGWTGLRTFAPDRRPMLGADPELEGLWWAAGLGGFGVTCSLAVGEAVAAWVRGQELDWIRPRGVSPGRGLLSRWPVRPRGELWETVMVG